MRISTSKTEYRSLNDRDLDRTMKFQELEVKKAIMCCSRVQACGNRLEQLEKV